MKSFRSSVLVAAILVLGVVVIASPAFATPNLTASSGTRAVAPFLTPSTNTSSQFTARTTFITLRIPSINSGVDCTAGLASGYVSTTHTQVRVTSLQLGDGSGRSCMTSWAGARGSVDGDQITCGASSASPWFWHFKAVNAGTRSASGTVNFITTCTFSINIAGNICTFTWDRGGSAAFNYTPPAGLLVVDGNIMVTLRGATCPFPGSALGTLRATYSLRPDTRRDTIPIVTAGS